MDSLNGVPSLDPKDMVLCISCGGSHFAQVNAVRIWRPVRRKQELEGQPYALFACIKCGFVNDLSDMRIIRGPKLHETQPPKSV